MYRYNGNANGEKTSDQMGNGTYDKGHVGNHVSKRLDVHDVEKSCLQCTPL